MDVRVLHIAACPHAHEAVERVRNVLADIGRPGVPVTPVLVKTEVEAEAAGFAGSPTILIDGEDPFPSADRTAGLACRVYPTEKGLAGIPSVQQLTDALRARLRALGDGCGRPGV